LSLIAAGLCSFSSAALAADENLLRMILSACASLGTAAKEALPQELVDLTGKFWLMDSADRAN